MRLAAFISALFYLISSIGYGLEVHYCLGRISDVNYVLLDTYCPCDDVHVSANASCCEERAFFNQIDDEHSVPSLIASEQAFVPSPIILFQEPRIRPKMDAKHALASPDRGPPRTVDRTIEFVQLITYG